MIAFTDRRGRCWSARLDVAAAIRMRDLAGVDVMALALGGTIEDPETVTNAVYAIVKPEADRLGITPRRFGRRLRGLFRWAVTPEELSEELSREIGEFLRTPELLPGRPKGKPREQTVERLWGLVWTFAGVVGIDPTPHTFGELVALADARRKHDWAQTASLMSFVSAANGRKGTPAETLDPTGGLAGGGSSNELKIAGRDSLRMAALIMGVN